MVIQKQIQINNQRIQIMVVMLQNQSKSLFPKDDSFILSRSKEKKQKEKNYWPITFWAAPHIHLYYFFKFPTVKKCPHSC